MSNSLLPITPRHSPEHSFVYLFVFQSNWLVVSIDALFVCSRMTEKLRTWCSRTYGQIVVLRDYSIHQRNNRNEHDISTEMCWSRLSQMVSIRWRSSIALSTSIATESLISEMTKGGDTLICTRMDSGTVTACDIYDSHCVHRRHSSKGQMVFQRYQNHTLLPYSVI